MARELEGSFAKWVRRAVLLLLSVGLASLATGQDEVEATPAVSIGHEYLDVDIARSRCGGHFVVRMQALVEEDGKRFDELGCLCPLCGEHVTFRYDISAFYGDAGIDAWTYPDGAAVKMQEVRERIPAPTQEDLEELAGYLGSDNTYLRSWAISAVGDIPGPDAEAALLKGLGAARPADYGLYVQALAGRGTEVMPALTSRLDTARGPGLFALLAVVERLGEPDARAALEAQIGRRNGLELRAACYALGVLGQRESEDALLAVAEGGLGAGDEGIIWALGRCGGARSHPILRELAAARSGRAPDGGSAEAGPLQLAAMGALGASWDRGSLATLMAAARTAGDPSRQVVAVHALGDLREPEAVPLLMEIAGGAYGTDRACRLIGVVDLRRRPRPWSSQRVEAILALGRLGDARAVPVLQNILEEESPEYDYWLYAAQAAADGGWEELVPAIVARMEKEQADLGGSYHSERYSPALRSLTGQDLPEDVAAWKEWLDSQGAEPGRR
jgi:HEAT repeat protein